MGQLRMASKSWTSWRMLRELDQSRNESYTEPSWRSRNGWWSSWSTRCRSQGGRGPNVCGIQSSCARMCLSKFAKTQCEGGKGELEKKRAKVSDARGRPKTLSPLALTLLTDVTRELLAMTSTTLRPCCKEVLSRHGQEHERPMDSTISTRDQHDLQGCVCWPSRVTIWPRRCSMRRKTFVTSCGGQ